MVDEPEATREPCKHRLRIFGGTIDHRYIGLPTDRHLVEWTCTGCDNGLLTAQPREVTEWDEDEMPLAWRWRVHTLEELIAVCERYIEPRFGLSPETLARQAAERRQEEWYRALKLLLETHPGLRALACELVGCTPDDLTRVVIGLTRLH